MALVGSGEFLPAMAEVDAALLRGRVPKVAVIPTASAPEGDERVAYWLELGRRHYGAMGVETVAVDVRRRSDADHGAVVDLLHGVGLVYLSGGDPHHLAETLGGTRLWEAVLDAWRNGTALAGCSAGAMALTAGAPPWLGPGRRRAAVSDGQPNGLGPVDALAVIPHFDRIEHWRPGAVAGYLAWQPPGTTLLGIEEETALVAEPGGGGPWQVVGRGSVWVLAPGERHRLAPGEELPAPSAPRNVADASDVAT